MISENVKVVVRSVGERTTDACIQSIVAQGFERNQITVVTAYPFSNALRVSLEAGLDAGKEWTLIVDADVLLRDDAVERLFKYASRRPENICEIHGLVLDKFFNKFRLAGNHLYRTNKIEQVLKKISNDRKITRPETHALNAMAQSGSPFEKIALVVGIHDFEQYRRDIFRKCFLQAHKHLQYSEALISYWRQHVEFDDDYRVALAGYAFGVQYEPDNFADAADHALNSAFENLELPEQNTIFCCSDPAFLARSQTQAAILGGDIGVQGFPLSARDLNSECGIGELKFSKAQRNEKIFRDYGRIYGAINLTGVVFEALGRSLQSFSRRRGRK